MDATYVMPRDRNPPYLMRGDRLPTVGVLQKLLNARADAGLKVDGVFGKRTEDAVWTFQMQRFINENGMVLSKTWTRLTAGLSLPILDVVDVQDEEFRLVDIPTLRAVGADVIEIGGQSHGVPQVVELVKRHIAAKSLYYLRLHAHGWHGQINLGRDTSIPNPTGQEFSAIQSVKGIRPIILALAPVFSPYGSVLMTSCGTGGARSGRVLVQGMANTLGVPVTGALYEESFSAMTTFRLEGKYFTACPNNMSLAAWCFGLPDVPRSSPP